MIPPRYPWDPSEIEQRVISETSRLLCSKSYYIEGWDLRLTQVILSELYIRYANIKQECKKWVCNKRVQRAKKLNKGIALCSLLSLQLAMNLLPFSGVL